MCAYVHKFACVLVSVSASVSVCLYTSECRCPFVCAHAHVCLPLCVCLCLFVCMSECVRAGGLCRVSACVGRAALPARLWPPHSCINTGPSSPFKQGGPAYVPAAGGKGWVWQRVCPHVSLVPSMPQVPGHVPHKAGVWSGVSLCLTSPIWPEASSLRSL